jgi:hypothetical protein
MGNAVRVVHVLGKGEPLGAETPLVEGMIGVAFYPGDFTIFDKNLAAAAAV